MLSRSVKGTESVAGYKHFCSYQFQVMLGYLFGGTGVKHETTWSSHLTWRSREDKYRHVLYILTVCLLNVWLAFCLLSPMEARRCYAVSDLQLGEWEVVLSARELGLNMKRHVLEI